MALLRALDKPRNAARFTFTDEDIVPVYSWAAIHDRPTGVRTYRRVQRWVQAKLVLSKLKRAGAADDVEIRTYAA